MSAHLDDYRVELDAYSGPLDLLLYLVRRHEIDLYDIPIAKLTEQYLEHLRVIEAIDFERAGEFLVMAATLLEIKSQMLVPAASEGEEQPAGDEADLNVADPRYELVQQLLAYKRYKDAAFELEERRREWEARFPIKPSKRELSAEEQENAPLDLEDVQVLDLCKAFARLLDSIGQKRVHEVTYDDTPIALHAEDIVDRLKRDGAKGGMTLQQIFVGRTNRSEMIGLFLAVLELVRQRRLRVAQDQPGGEVKLELRPEDEQAAGDEDQPDRWKNPETGEVEYDWPSEEARKRAERRARLRANRLAKMRGGAAAEADGGDEDDDEDEIIDLDDELAGEEG